ncbi:hypothetical protein BC938DRAFT_477282 [Jimgerdemannia flammicorona]|uniref:Uncharacterized protein n=1 Tax=Jimgerdemannia flammicorona TaxID=994334 RepID=A0A433QYV4_9FUNG|nr:hypothetical protein BC938DRAFT_477282 [Jimgerdemannia flammicorona]
MQPILDINNIVAAELDATDFDLGNERDDGESAVAANDRDAERARIGVDEVGDQGRGVDDIKSRDTEDPSWVVNFMLLEDLDNNRDGLVDRIGHDNHEGLRAVSGGGVGDVPHTEGVYPEQLLRSFGPTVRDGGNEDDIRVLDGLLERGMANMTSDYALGIDVAQVDRDTLSVYNIVEGQVVDEVDLFQEYGERMADSTSSTADGNFDHVSWEKEKEGWRGGPREK